MGIVIRTVVSREFDAFSHCLDQSFGVRSTSVERERFFRELEGAHLIGAFDGGELVGTLSHHEAELTLPGPLTHVVTGMSDVGVLASHRRRGIFRRLMKEGLLSCHRTGVAIAVLHASEGGIYGNLGFGPATFSARYRIDEPYRQRHDADAVQKGTVRMLSPFEARSCLPEVFDDARRCSVGEVGRSQQWWEALFESLETTEAPFRFAAAFEHEGSIDGYAIYEWTDRAPTSVDRAVRIVDICAVANEAYAPLWRFLFGLGASTLWTQARPVDDALRHLLRDPRSLKVELISDAMWLRLIDVCSALSLRRYHGPGSVTIAVRDEQCSWNDATFLVEVDEYGVASVNATPSSAEISSDIQSLSAAFLGGTSFSNLGRTGAVSEHVEGAFARADVLFHMARAPFCSSAF